jgi:hypothetical protein
MENTNYHKKSVDELTFTDDGMFQAVLRDPEIYAENNYVELDDKSLKVIYNSSAYEKESNEKIRDFLKYIYTNEPGEDDFSKRISAMVEKIKDNDKFRRDYAAMNLHDRDIQRAAKKEGAQEKAVENAINFLRMKIGTVEQIAQGTGLPVEEVEKLADEL